MSKPTKPIVYTVMRPITMAECPWLKRSIEFGEHVYKFGENVYVSDAGIAVTHEPDMEPFFELPHEALHEQGKEHETSGELGRHINRLVEYSKYDESNYPINMHEFNKNEWRMIVRALLITDV